MLAARAAVGSAQLQTRTRPARVVAEPRPAKSFTAVPRKQQRQLRRLSMMGDREGSPSVIRGAAKRRGVVQRLLSRTRAAPHASVDSDKEKGPRPFGGRLDPDIVALVLVYFIQGALGALPGAGARWRCCRSASQGLPFAPPSDSLRPAPRASFAPFPRAGPFPHHRLRLLLLCLALSRPASSLSSLFSFPTPVPGRPLTPCSHFLLQR